MAAGVVVAILSSALPYSLEIFALQRLPRRAFGVLMSLEPAAGAVAGFLLLGETLRPVQWLAIALVIAASLGTVATARRQAPQDELLAP
jgi:inner membrane transporter RhtA